MSAAHPVPETRDLEGDRPRDLLQRTGPSTMLRDTVRRFRTADGTSHARASAFQLVLTLVPAMVVMVALAAQLRWRWLADAIVRTAESVAPGATVEVLRTAFDEGTTAGSTGNWTAITTGGVAVIVSGASSFGQIERALNRFYGIEVDRPTGGKYLRAFAMFLVSGTLVGAAFAAVGVGNAWASDGGGSSGPDRWWDVVRWPIGALCLAASLFVVVRWSPRRRQPGARWLLPGTLLAMAGVVLVSLLLSGYLSASSSFGETYGPLAGFLGLLLWAYAASAAACFGFAFDAQLEAVRARSGATVSDEKIAAGEPDAAVVPYAEALRRT